MSGSANAASTEAAFIETVSGGGDRTVSGLGRGLAIAAILLVAIDLRPGIVSVGPILPSIIDEFGLSYAAASLLITIPDLLMGLLALPTPWLVRRYGRDPVLLSALLLLCLSTLVRALSPNVASLLLATAGVGAGIAIAGALIAGFIKARFPTKAAMMMGIYATALSFGSTVSAGVTGPVAANLPGGWRLASGLWSLLGIFAILGWLAVALRERRDRPAAVGTAAVMHRLPLGNRTAWLVALFFACDNFLFYALLSWTAPMYREYGLSPTTAGLVLASFPAAFMCATPVFGWLSKSEDRRGWLAICGGLTVAGLVLLAVAPMAAPFAVIALCAFGLGGGFTLGMTLPLDNTHSVEEANVWNAFVLTVGYLIASAGPLLVGSVRDLSGDFRPAMWLLVAVGAAMLVLSPFLRPHHHRPGA
ncbi:CynX/NimT family MFS transporter [Methylobacterium brachythecii]|nr:MFS transporter [Methylobacterium brachythecii]MBB3901408.1 CP family cyanate transporter-like MFS transporter [Methylobacterium brachythecii]